MSADERDDATAPAADALRATAGSASAATREAAFASGRRALEVHAHTPRLNAWYLEQFAGRLCGDVLELGSGLGNLSRPIRQQCRSLVVTDVEPAYLEALHQAFHDVANVDVCRFDLDYPPPPALAARRFDAIISLNVLEHVARDDQAVRQLVRLLRPGGALLTYVPACPAAFGPMDTALGHHRRYTRRSLARLMTQAGLRVERLHAMNLLGLLGWSFNNHVLRRTRPDPAQVAAFERLVPLVRAAERRFRVPVGLGLVAVAGR